MQIIYQRMQINANFSIEIVFKRLKTDRKNL